MTYKTHGTCSSLIHYDIVDGKLHDVRFENGCNGNLKAIGILVEGLDAKEAVRKLKGIRCGWNETSCADQLAHAIESSLPAD